MPEKSKFSKQTCFLIITAPTTTRTVLCCFLLQSLSSFCVTSFVPQVLWIWESVFYFQGFFTLNSFTAFGTCTATTCYHESFPRSWLFFHKVSRVFYKGLKHIPSPFVCLNHRVFRKYMISKELYLNLSKVVDKLLVAKGLRGKLKETQIDSSVLF